MNINDVEDIGIQVLNLPHDHAIQPDQAGGLFPPSRYYLFFRLLAEKYKFKTAVVLGVCGGGDSFHLCKGNPDGNMIGVDIARDHEEQMVYIEAHCAGFKFWLGDSVTSALAVHEAYGPIDFIFIDTTHVLDATIAEFEAWKPFLSPGALVCFDDLYRTEMAGVWESLPEPKLRMDLLHDGSPGIGGGFGFLINQ